uniref:C-type lectin domain-containing protein n=1 Tax=Panagrolaimus davidi TaxID=227884 RepID=A0A914PM26_9BILA
MAANIPKRVFVPHLFTSHLNWEHPSLAGMLYKLLDGADCPKFGVMFHPKSKTFDITDKDHEFFSFCETPRFAKLQCEKGWHLIPQLRMCLNVHQEFVNFFQAHKQCKKEGAFIATAQNEWEVEMLRNVIVPYNLQSLIIDDIYGFWVGLKSEGHETFSMDGTKPMITVGNGATAENFCQALSYKNFIDKTDGQTYLAQTLSCIPKYPFSTAGLPYMCQKFADQSLINNVQ